MERSLPEDARDEKTIDDAVAAFVEAYDRRYLDKTAPYEGILELLAKLCEKGIALGVNSNKRSDYTSALIKSISHIFRLWMCTEKEREYPRSLIRQGR